MRIDLALYSNEAGAITIRSDGGSVVLGVAGVSTANHPDATVERRLVDNEALDIASALVDAYNEANQLDADPSAAELAEEIVVTHLDHSITIDGEPFRHAFGEDWRVDGGPIPTLTITIPAVRVLVK